MTTRTPVRFGPCSVVLLLSACGGGSDGSMVIPPPPPPVNAIQVEQVFTTLPAFNEPLAMLQAPGDDSRWYVVERGGLVHVFDNDPSVSTSSVVIDLSGVVDSGPGEAGLLGMAFHPDFQNNGEVFLSFTRPGLVSYVSRFMSVDGGMTIDPNTEEVVLTVDQPFDNHNGGNIAFGPDGFLYIGFGDGGSGDDPTITHRTPPMLGDMLRIDVDGGNPHAIPVGNPFAGNPLCSQGGVRRRAPRSSRSACAIPGAGADSMTGDPWVGATSVRTRGRDRSRDRRRQLRLAHPRRRTAIPSDLIRIAIATGLIDPVAEYDHTQGQAVTGGFVYRGQASASLVGAYLYADFVSGRIWGLFDDGAGGLEVRELAQTSLGISSFAQGNDGELYVVDLNAGGIYHLVE